MIFGTSGGGKTTLLNILGTIDTATKGNVVILGQRVTPSTPDPDLAKVRLHSLGFVFQSFNLLSTMTATENVELPMVLAGKLDALARAERCKGLLTSVGLEHRLSHLPSQMSGGEQQRATIARALANEPSILLMDEPTGDLDTKNTFKVLDILLRLNHEKGITIVMVTHDTNMKNYAHRAVYMRDGKLHHIEDIPHDRRFEAIANVRKEVDDMARKIQVVDQVAAAAPIEYRTPENYSTHRALRPAASTKSTNPFMNERVLGQLFGVGSRGGGGNVSALVEEMEMRTTLAAPSPSPEHLPLSDSHEFRQALT